MKNNCKDCKHDDCWMTERCVDCFGRSNRPNFEPKRKIDWELVIDFIIKTFVLGAIVFGLVFGAYQLGKLFQSKANAAEPNSDEIWASSYKQMDEHLRDWILHLELTDPNNPVVPHFRSYLQNDLKMAYLELSTNLYKQQLADPNQRGICVRQNLITISASDGEAVVYKTVLIGVVGYYPIEPLRSYALLVRAR